MREQSAAQAAKIADPNCLTAMWVVDGDGKPIQGIPYAPKSWLTDQAGQLLPQGATKATKDGEAVVKAALAASPARLTPDRASTIRLPPAMPTRRGRESESGRQRSNHGTPRTLQHESRSKAAWGRGGPPGQPWPPLPL